VEPAKLLFSIWKPSAETVAFKMRMVAPVETQALLPVSPVPGAQQAEPVMVARVIPSHSPTARGRLTPDSFIWLVAMAEMWARKDLVAAEAAVVSPAVLVARAVTAEVVAPAVR
jgi:hypothetical protein